MKFKKVFRGYDPQQVDKYIEETNARNEQIRLAQKQYLEELTEENLQLRQQVKQYQQDELAISKSLVESQKLADQLKNDAVRFSEVVLTRAKVFYAAWRVYSQTLIATLSPEEVIQFNRIVAKIENIINAYEGKNVSQDSQAIVDQAKNHVDQPEESSQSEEQSQAVVTTVDESSPDLMPSDATMGVYANPIGKVEQAVEQVIDLRELTQIDESLEDLCADLGLINKPEDEEQ